MFEHMIANSDVFACPACAGGLNISADKIGCVRCNAAYEVHGRIPVLYSPSCQPFGAGAGVTDKIKAFYERNPFPNYEASENSSDLVRKARSGILARLLDEQIPLNIRVLEVGCGTGQLSNFLGISPRTVFGTDICLNSLNIADEFRARNNLDRVGFYQMDLFKPAFKSESFPLVICSGVLHHTSDPGEGFDTIARLVKKGGYIIIGLYNKFGRFSTDLRRFVFKMGGSGFRFLDKRLLSADIGDVRKLTWYRDQYENPHESRHSIGEVMRWLENSGFDYINGIPKPKLFESFGENEKLFEPNSAGSRLDHFIVQLSQIFAPSGEGGFFLVIGRKRV